MKCPICGKEVTLENKQVGVAENGEPILNRYAICRDCKKQWNLDKQRAKKAAAKTKDADGGQPKKASSKPAAQKPQPDKNPMAKPHGDKASAAKPVAKKLQSAGDKAPASKAAVKTPTNASSDAKVPVGKAPAAKAATSKSPADKAQPAEKPAGSSQANKAVAASQSTTSAKKSGEPVTRPIPQRKVHEAMLAEETESVKSSPQKTSDAPAKKTPARKPIQKDSDSEVKRVRKTSSTSEARRTRKADADAKRKPARKTIDFDEAAESKKKAADPQTYGNIPPEKVRAKRALAVKKGYEDMLASDPKSAAAKKRAEAAKQAEKKAKESAKKGRHDEDYEDESFDDLPRFRVLRIILGILSLAAGVYFGYTGFQTSVLPYYVLAGCMGVSGLLLLILQMSNTLFTYLIPMMLYTAGGVFAFLERDDDPVLLYTSIVSVVLGVIFLILAFSSRRDEDYDDYEEEEDDEDDGDDWDD